MERGNNTSKSVVRSTLLMKLFPDLRFLKTITATIKGVLSDFLVYEIRIIQDVK